VDLWIPSLLAVTGFGAGWFIAPLTERYCGALSVGRRYAVALVTAVVFAVLAWRLGATVLLAAYLYLGAVGTVLTFVDIAVKRLPDPFTLPSYVVGPVLLLAAAPFTADGWPRLAYALVGMALLWLVYGLQHFVLPNAIGRGDVKLAGVLGLYLGWFGQSTWLIGLLLGFVFGGLVAVGLLLTRRACRKTEIPFGPYMMAGALVAILVHPGVTL
jgi:prepilin signal peptidase PulO-like enzyme (type II secretory pathway)